jgi:opacity protein-like surface antigen
LLERDFDRTVLEGKSMWLRRVSAVAVALVVSLAYSESARSNESGAYAGATVAAMVGALVCSSVALGLQPSDDTSEFERKGWFVNLAGTYAVEKFESSIGDELSGAVGEPVNAETDDSLGLNVGGGYRCHRYLSTELELEWIDEFQTDFSGTDVIGSADPDPMTITTNFKGYLPFGRFQPYALAGGGIIFTTVPARAVTTAGPIEWEEKVRAFAFRFGGGLDFYATEHIVLNIGAEQVIPVSADLDLNYISVGWGIQYRF